MTDLVWLLYASDLAGNLSVLLGGAGILCLAVAAFNLMMLDEQHNEAGRQECWRRIKRAVPAAALCFLVISLIPSKTTIYVYAGAVAAERTVASEIGQKTIRLLEQRIDEMLSEGEGE